MTAEIISTKLRKLADKDKAKLLQRFFKTGPGEYGEGDIFLGINVPAIRKLSKKHEGLPLEEAVRLLKSPFHEERLLALLLLVRLFSKGDEALKKKIFDLYLNHTKYINNWDLVDLTAPNIVGTYLLDKSREPLYSLVASNNLWKRRISILATLAFIRQDDFGDTLGISKTLLSDDRDLIHKAVGWMLREVGKRSMTAEERFLREHCRKMPRTTLRYAIERFPEAKRKKYLNGTI